MRYVGKAEVRKIDEAESGVEATGIAHRRFLRPRIFWCVSARAALARGWEGAVGSFRSFLGMPSLMLSL